ncbi:hypothetical protein II898_06660 [bacterium]|nr:hypothetical protein [bacterium]
MKRIFNFFSEEVIYKNFKELLEDKAAYDKMAHAWTSQSLCESQLGRRTTAHLYGET